MGHMKNRDSNRRRREDRQVQAKVRQESYDKLSTAEKLVALPTGGCVKQRIKLTGQLIAESGPRRSATLTIAEVNESFDALNGTHDVVKIKKGSKAKRQAKNDKKAKE